MPTSNYTQDKRPLAITTPLGKDRLLLVGCSGQEAISSLFKFEAEALAPKENPASFDGLLGKSVTVQLQLTGNTFRYVNGIVNAVMEGGRDDTFTSYRLEIVPKLWLLTRKSHSRLFQQMNVRDILKQVLQGIDYDDGGLQGKFENRDYCVQYRETDFNFASRLMEEEGIYYFFQHANGSHKLMLGNTPLAHKDLSGIETGTLIFDPLGGGNRPEERVYGWTKTQEMQFEKVTLWDHSFELPHKNLEGNKDILQSVQVGTINHKLKVGGSENLELYDWPGQYAQRFDGVSPGGGDQPSEIQKIFQDNQRTAEIRMGEQAAGTIVIAGSSNSRALTSGYKFKLDRHFDANGSYVLTSVQHYAHQDAYRSSGNDPFTYHNSFTCIPLELPYRPRRVTPKPVIQGTQSAVVVGPSGEEIFTDKYGRVHVRFHWDRDQKSACWVRVVQLFAGKRWGSSFWPRIGQEVIVAFEEGDPDRPIIVGSVYNAEQMPPYLGDGPDPKHPRDNRVSGIKTCTTKGGNGYNELRFDDTKGKEQIFIHAEKDTDTYVKNDTRTDVGGNVHLTVGYQNSSAGGNMTEKFKQNKTTRAEQNIDVYADQQHTIYTGTSGACIQQMSREGSFSSKAEQTFSIKAGQTVVIEGAMGISLTCGGSFISITPEMISISGPMVNINSGGSSSSATDLSYTPPPNPDQTDNSKPGFPSNTSNT